MSKTGNVLNRLLLFQIVLFMKVIKNAKDVSLVIQLLKIN